MSNYAISLKRTTALLAALTFLSLLTVVNISSFFGQANAADLANRSLTLSSTLPGDATDGDPGDATNGAEATHTFNFTTVNTADYLVLNYCTTAIGACVAPTGLDLSAATIESQDGAVISGFTTITPGNSDMGGTGNALDITGGAIVAGAGEIAIGNVTNPTTLGTFFVRIQTWEVVGGGDPDELVDEGTVASAITEGIEITARVAETLGFSTTGEIDTTNVPVPGGSCDPVTGSGAITLGDPIENTLDITQAYDNYSVFRLYTNASGGVAVQYRGATLTRASGEDIDAIDGGSGSAVASAPGTEQFGLAIDTSVGSQADVDAASRENMNMSNVTTAADLALDGPLNLELAYAGGDGLITSGGDALFAFVPDTATTIATTAGYTECKTAAVRYLANISPTTTSGVYTTTIVYSAVPTY